MADEAKPRRMYFKGGELAEDGTITGSLSLGETFLEAAQYKRMHEQAFDEASHQADEAERHLIELRAERDRLAGEVKLARTGMDALVKAHGPKLLEEVVGKDPEAKAESTPKGLG